MEDTSRCSHITIGILAHVDAGKTTLSESMMYLTGQIRTLGRVDHKDAFLDTQEPHSQELAVYAPFLPKNLRAPAYREASLSFLPNQILPAWKIS